MVVMTGFEEWWGQTPNGVQERTGGGGGDRRLQVTLCSIAVKESRETGWRLEGEGGQQGLHGRSCHRALELHVRVC